ncbi:MAG: MATE family efflux transporter [Coriobacteriia bacterium]|nr:MATE family efflux transporter [Coriobacteriia bacterium]
MFNSFYLGFSIASAPLMSYQYGAKNKTEMRNLLKCCLTIIIVSSVICFALSEVLAPAFAGIFVSYDAQLEQYSVYAFRIYSILFLFAGISIYGSSLFTSLGDGLTSALIAFLRTLVFEAAALLILPEIIGSDGI